MVRPQDGMPRNGRLAGLAEARRQASGHTQSIGRLNQSQQRSVLPDLAFAASLTGKRWNISSQLET
jgi:hypothetical protein